MCIQLKLDTPSYDWYFEFVQQLVLDAISYLYLPCFCWNRKDNKKSVKDEDLLESSDSQGTNQVCSF